MDPSRIASLHQALVVVSTVTGSVTFLVTRHPEKQIAQITHMGAELEIERRLVVVTPHAERIASELRAEFAEKALTVFGDRPWFHVDWEDVERVVGEFDPVTGRRLRRGDVAVGDHVQVDITTASVRTAGKRRGEVTAISGRRYLIRLDEAIGDFTGMWAPRSQIKPIVRTCALVGAA